MLSSSKLSSVKSENPFCVGCCDDSHLVFVCSKIAGWRADLLLVLTIDQVIGKAEICDQPELETSCLFKSQSLTVPGGLLQGYD